MRDDRQARLAYRRALRMCEQALWELSQTAGDVPAFNEGGSAYEAISAARAALAND